MTVDHKGAWGDFWKDNAAPSGGGCLPDRWQSIEQAQRRAWDGFAQDLPRNARALDLATGDGRVMAWLLATRLDLKLIGTDLAPTLPPAPKGTKMRAGVAMESLPFPDRRFAAVVSQFGFEYGNPAKAAREVKRVLRDDGVVGLMTHRKDGPILAHNLARREQIAWAIEEKDLPDIAKRSLALRSTGMAAIPPAIAQAPELGARQFGTNSAAWEIAEAIRRTLAFGRNDHPANVAATIDLIASKASNELARIASLEAACAQTADERSFLSALEGAGLHQASVTPIVEVDGQPPFADFRLFNPT